MMYCHLALGSVGVWLTGFKLEADEGRSLLAAVDRLVIILTNRQTAAKNQRVAEVDSAPFDRWFFGFLARDCGRSQNSRSACNISGLKLGIM